jgi:hypothetical protein
LLPRLAQSPNGSESPDVTIIPAPSPTAISDHSDNEVVIDQKASTAPTSLPPKMVPIGGPPTVAVNSPADLSASVVIHNQPLQQLQSQSVTSSPESNDNSLQAVKRTQVVAAPPPVLSDDSISGLSQNFPTSAPVTAPGEKAKLSFAGILKTGTIHTHARAHRCSAFTCLEWNCSFVQQAVAGNQEHGCQNT